MKKLILSFLLISLTAFVFGQSVTLSPTGDEVLVQSYGSSSGGSFYGRNAGGTASSPTATVANSPLTLLGARGHTGAGYPQFPIGSQGLIGIYANQTFSTTALGTHIRFETTNDNTTSRVERMRIAPNGNVGIGTNSPSSKLHLVDGSITTTPDVSSLLTLEHTGDVGLSMLSGNTSASKIFFGSTLGNTRGLISYSPTTNNMDFGTNALTRMTINGSGNVGIGINPAITKLHVANGSSGAGSPPTGTIATFESNGNTYLSLLTPNGGFSSAVTFGSPGGNYRAGIGFSTTNKMFFSHSGSDRMVLDHLGNFGIGTTSPNAKLEVAGTYAISGRTTLTGNQNDYNLGGKSVIFVNGGGTYTLTGIAGGVDGMIVHIYVETTTDLIIANNSASSLVGNKIVSGSNTDIITSQGGGVTLIYDGTALVWRVIGWKV